MSQRPEKLELGNILYFYFSDLQAPIFHTLGFGICCIQIYPKHGSGMVRTEIKPIVSLVPKEQSSNSL